MDSKTALVRSSESGLVLACMSTLPPCHFVLIVALSLGACSEPRAMIRSTEGVSWASSMMLSSGVEDEPGVKNPEEVRPVVRGGAGGGWLGRMKKRRT